MGLLCFRNTRPLIRNAYFYECISGKFCTLAQRNSNGAAHIAIFYGILQQIIKYLLQSCAIPFDKIGAGTWSNLTMNFMECCRCTMAGSDLLYHVGNIHNFCCKRQLPFVELCYLKEGIHDIGELAALLFNRG